MKRVLASVCLAAVAGCSPSSPVGVPVVTTAAEKSSRDEDLVRRELLAANEAVQRGDWAAAMERLDTAQGIKYTPSGFTIRAAVYAGQKDLSSAVRECDRGLVAFPGDAKLQSLRAEFASLLAEQLAILKRVGNELEEFDRAKQREAEEEQRKADKRAEEERRWKEMERERKQRGSENKLSALRESQLKAAEASLAVEMKRRETLVAQVAADKKLLPEAAKKVVRIQNSKTVTSKSEAALRQAEEELEAIQFRIGQAERELADGDLLINELMAEIKALKQQN